MVRTKRISLWGFADDNTTTTICNSTIHYFKLLALYIGLKLGSGCGSVGRAVASNTRGPWFKSSRRQNFIMNIVYSKLY